MDEVAYIYTMEYYLVIKRNEVLIHSTTYMSLEDMLSERSLNLKTYCMISFICNVSGKPIETGSRLVFAWSWGERGGGRKVE